MQVCDSAQYHDDHAFSSPSVLSKEPFFEFFFSTLSMAGLYV